jgi:hypothetical protein
MNKEHTAFDVYVFEVILCSSISPKARGMYNLQSIKYVLRSWVTTINCDFLTFVPELGKELIVRYTKFEQNWTYINLVITY